MKRTIVCALIGLAGGAVPSYGVTPAQEILFSNYNSSTGPTINYSSYLVPPGKAGLSVGSEFSAELAYYIGTTSNPQDLTLLPGSITAFGFNPGSSPAADGDLYGGAGWFFGPDISLPSAVAGATVTLDVYAFNNGSLVDSTISGSSGPFQVFLSNFITPPVDMGNMPNFTVSEVVPEPTSLPALGFGVLGSMLFYRRRNRSER